MNAHFHQHPEEALRCWDFLEKIDQTPFPAKSEADIRRNINGTDSNTTFIWNLPGSDLKMQHLRRHFPFSI